MDKYIRRVGWMPMSIKYDQNAAPGLGAPALLEAVRDIKTSVDTSVAALGDRITILEQSSTKDIADLAEAVKTGQHSEEQLQQWLTAALDKQAREIDERNQLPGGGFRVQGEFKMPKFWGNSDLTEMCRAADFDIHRAIAQLEGRALVDALIAAPPVDDNHRYLQHLATDVWIADTVAKTTAFAMNKEYEGFVKRFPKLSRLWGSYLSSYLESMGKAASDSMDTGTSTNASEWVPTRFTSEVFELIKSKTRVAAVFDRFTMPGSPYDWPVDMTDTLGVYKTESTSAISAFDSNMQKVVSRKVTFAAKKFRARIVSSGEMSEDAMMPVIPIIRKRLVETQANNEETAVINGDTAGTHQDADIEVVTDHPAKAWLGLRAWCIDKSKTTDADPNLTTSLDAFVSIRASMGEHGENPEDLIYATSIAKSLNLLNIDKIETLEKYGNQATILRGEVGRIYGVPLVASRYFPSNLNVLGINDGATVDNTAYLCVNRRAWMIGDLREVTIEAERVIQNDTVDIVSWRRLDFQHMYGTETSETAAWMAIDVAN